MTMSEFVFLYRGGESGRSPERIQQSMQKWMAWFKELGQNGHVKDQGQPLERTGKLVKGKQKTVTDGPFAEAKEVIGGYWIIQVRSREEAIEWAKRAPMSNNEMIEVRQIHEMPDFTEDMQKAAEGFEHRNP
jgi:hypothetical protein